MKIKNKRLRKLCGTLAVLSFLLLLGTAGACDNETIAMSQIVVQSAFALAGFVGFGYLSKAIV